MSVDRMSQRNCACCRWPVTPEKLRAVEDGFIYSYEDRQRDERQKKQHREWREQKLNVMTAAEAGPSKSYDDGMYQDY